MFAGSLKHGVALLFPVLAALALYQRSFRIWFLNDDFAWLGLGLSLENGGTLWSALFSPMAQGTIRTLSERLFFLAFERNSGLESLPPRLATFATLAIAQVLLILVVRRLSGSLGAGITAAILWPLNFGVTVALCWLSSYNQILLSALLLASFYCFLRFAESRSTRWYAAAWLFYLLGFGALENIIVLPGILLAWTLLFQPALWRRTLPFFLPALLFAFAHLFLIPKPVDAGTYRMYFDASLFTSLLVYWNWFLGASKLTDFDPAWQIYVTPIQWIVTSSLLGFVLWRSLRRDFTPLFGLLLSAALIAPVLPLREHRTDYYVASASLGLTIALALMPFRLPRFAAAAAWAVLAIFSLTAYVVQQNTIEWYLARTAPLRPLIRGLFHGASLHPGKLILLEGITNEIYDSALADDALRLIPNAKIRLAPGNGPAQNPHALDNSAVRKAFEEDAVVVYRFDGSRLHDVTRQWESGPALLLSSGLSAEVDAGSPVYNRQFSGGWFPPEDGRRWLGQSGLVHLGGPFSSQAQLHLQGFSPAAANQNRLKVKIGSFEHTATISPGPFTLKIPLPAPLLSQASLAVELSANQTISPPGDGRALSFVFGSISIQ